MTDRWEEVLDGALADLARAEESARPRPGPALTARVLADAAAACPAAPAAPGAGAAPAPARRGWRALWPAALPGPALLAGAALACLSLGVGLGYITGGAETEAAFAAFDGRLLAVGAVSDFPL